MATVEIAGLPETAEEFIALRDRLANTPEGGAAMMVVALLLYAEDESLGLQCLTIAVDKDRLEHGSEGYKGWQLRASDRSLLRSQIGRCPYTPRSYIAGTTPQDGYNLPAPPYTIELSANPYSGDRTGGPYKLFIHSSGASRPRPVTLKRNERGIWKAAEWSSLIVGVRPPVEAVDEL